MARNRLGQFTRRAASRMTLGARRIGAAGIAARRLGRFEPITGTEVSGVVSGPTIEFGPPVEPQAATRTRTKSTADE